jgi:Family of unknown function (DUF5719)
VASRRPLPLLGVLALALIAVGVASSISTPTNPSALPGGLGVANAESTALYCTGLSGVAGSLARGHVTFLNTTGSSRSVLVQVVSDTGQHASTSIHLGAHAARSINPESLVSGHSFGLEAQVSGGGVVADEVTANHLAQVPCSSVGVTNWYGAGFDTLVGSAAYVSVYNPTATPAVFNVAAYTANGYDAPQTYQGLSVAAHAQMELSLGTEIVDTSNIGVHVSVLRGSIEVVGVQQSGTSVSLNAGATVLASQAWFPRVTTVANALAQLRVANPGGLAETVTATVDLAPFKVAPQVVTIAPYSSAEVVITPNTAIPADGYASVTLTSSEPFFSSLASGSSAGLSLWTPQGPSSEFLVADFSGLGFDAATVTSTSTKTLTVHFATLGATSVTGSVRLAGDTTESILALFTAIPSLSDTTLLVRTSSPDLLVTTTLPARPTGAVVVDALDGG